MRHPVIGPQLLMSSLRVLQLNLSKEVLVMVPTLTSIDSDNGPSSPVAAGPVVHPPQYYPLPQQGIHPPSSPAQAMGYDYRQGYYPPFRATYYGGPPVWGVPPPPPPQMPHASPSPSSQYPLPPQQQSSTPQSGHGTPSNTPPMKSPPKREPST